MQCTIPPLCRNSKPVVECPSCGGKLLLTFSDTKYYGARHLSSPDPKFQCNKKFLDLLVAKHLLGALLRDPGTRKRLNIARECGHDEIDFTSLGEDVEIAEHETIKGPYQAPLFNTNYNYDFVIRKGGKVVLCFYILCTKSRRDFPSNSRGEQPLVVLLGWPSVWEMLLPREGEHVYVRNILRCSVCNPRKKMTM